MRALVVYESMFGNTRRVAEQIAHGMGPDVEVTVSSVQEVFASPLSGFDLVVVGGPTHVHGLSRQTSRTAAADKADKDPDLAFEPDADGPGLREWLDTVGPVSAIRAAAFDTRADAPEILTGHASHGIAKRLRRHGFVLVADPESFLVDKHDRLLADEADRAAEWGEAVAASTMVG